MKNLLTILTLSTALVLAACGESKNSSADSASSDTKIRKTSSKKTGFLVTMTGLEASGNDCIAAIKLENKTGEYVRLFQFIKYTAVSKGGDYSDHGSHYKLEDGEKTTRAGVLIANSACKDVQEIRVTEMLCEFKRDSKTMESRSCLGEVSMRGYKKVKLVTQ